jgi:RNA polymerase sigma-70 factor (ECF subfamily)
VHAIARSDEADFVALRSEHRAGLRGHLAKFTHSADDINDIEQDVWAKVWLGWHTFDRRRPFGAWLHRIAERAGLDWQRRERRRLRIEDAAVVKAEAECAMNRDRDPSALEQIDHAERRAKVAAILPRAKGREREVLELIWGGLTVAEVAELLHMSTIAARKAHDRGIRRLRTPDTKSIRERPDVSESI